MKRSSRIEIYSYLLAIYLVYSTIANYSVYFLSILVNSIIVLLLCVYGFVMRPSIVVRRNRDALLFLFGWIIVFFLSVVVNGVFPSLNLLASFVLCLFILYLDVNVLQSVFIKFGWILSFLLLLSAIEYVFFIVTGKSYVIAHVTRVTQVKEGNFYHLLFNLITTHDIFYRFKGLFTEPGTMGTLCGFMLFATWRIKSMKFPFFVCLICGLMTISLGYYVFLIIFLFTNFKFSKKNVVVGSIILITFLSVFYEYVENRLFYRLSSVENIEQLDNRTTDTFDRYFKRAFENGELWFGVGSNNLPHQITDPFLYGGKEGGNAGVKKWIYEYGIFGFVLLFFIYNSIYYRRCKKRQTVQDWVFIFVFWACFYKNSILIVPTLFIIFLMIPIINNQINDKRLECMAFPDR